MNEHYLSENIVIKEAHMYYQEKLIKRHNWHIKLEELGWSKLHKQWIKKLNKLNNPYPNNSLFGALECGDNGDCLFHCISYALNTVCDEFYGSQDIRQNIAESITQEQFDNIIICYRSMKDLDDFDESWDPYEIDTLEKFKEEICKTGHSYWGDHLLLQLLVETFKINVCILTQNEFTETYEPYPTAISYDKDRDTIILIYENNSHFKLLGHFNDIMITNFNHNTLPLEIKRLFNL
tara:strand:+ start:242 stop:949 length:708 start_codon:yes stop_codon:yes gene_type:complete